MSRVLVLIMAALATCALSPALLGMQQTGPAGRRPGSNSPSISAGPQGGLKLGQPFQGEITGASQPKTVLSETKKKFGRLSGFMMPNGRAVEIPIQLKAGQALTVSVTVLGNDRQVGLILRDPTGQQIAISNSAELKSNELLVEEVAASGTYKIVVVSDQIGRFTLRADSAAEPGDVGVDEDADALRAKIQRLKQELAEAEAKLNALQGNSTPSKRDDAPPSGRITPNPTPVKKKRS